MTIAPLARTVPHPPMTKRPHLYLVAGNAAAGEGRVYRLRGTCLQAAPAQKVWPEPGAWRDLVRRLARNPVK